MDKLVFILLSEQKDKRRRFTVFVHICVDLGEIYNYKEGIKLKRS